MKPFNKMSLLIWVISTPGMQSLFQDVPETPPVQMLEDMEKIQ
jgi:hypothetical protein